VKCPDCQTIMRTHGAVVYCSCGKQIDLPKLPKGGSMRSFEKRFESVEVIRAKV